MAVDDTKVAGLAQGQASVSVGDLAPDFALPNQHREEVRLGSLRGRAVTIVFMPYAFSRICTGEICSLRDGIHDLVSDQTRLMSISCDSTYALKRWGETEGIEFDLLSDYWPHGQVARSYGVLDAITGSAMRGTFIVDREGIVRWKVVNGSKDPRNTASYSQVLGDLR